jgi:hypothetical protein
MSDALHASKSTRGWARAQRSAVALFPGGSLPGRPASAWRAVGAGMRAVALVPGGSKARTPTRVDTGKRAQRRPVHE